MPSCCRFCSLVGVSITNPDLRFINMILSSAISNRLANSFSKNVTTFDLRDSDFRIYKGRVRLYTSYCSLMLHICNKEFKFRACSALPMVQLVTASFSGENLLILPTVWHPYSVIALLAVQQLLGGCILLAIEQRR